MQQAIEQLEQDNPVARQRLVPGRLDQPKVVFMFPDRIEQHLALTAVLYRTESVFRLQLDKCAQILKPALGLDICELVLGNARDEQTVPQLLSEPWVNQPLLFAIEYALAMQWMSSGVLPNAMLGAGPGEYVAACLAGVFELPDALRLVAARGRLGPVATDQDRLAFAAQVQTCKPQAPTIECWSNPTGKQLTSEQALDPTYWVRQMQEPVLRAAGLERLLEQQDTLFIEVGPGDVLATQAAKHHLGTQSRLILPTLSQQGRKAGELSRQWLDCLGKIWCAGFELDWRVNWTSPRRARIALPAYPFEKTRHWIDR